MTGANMIAPPWIDAAEGWLEAVETWVGEQLAQRGQRLVGPLVQPHLRPWSTVLHASTGEGDVYFKAVSPAMSNEVRLTQALAGWRPDLVLVPLAADPLRGWILFPDGGTRMREVVRAEGSPELWREFLPAYAGLQIELAGRVGQLSALQTPDRRLERLPEQFASLLEDSAAVRLGQEDGLSLEQMERLAGLKPRLVELCQELAGYSIPETLNHGDLHDGNLFWNQGRYALFDWGDASLSHPFFSIRTVLVSLEISLDWEENDPRGLAWAELYLRAWQDFAGWEALEQAYRLSRPLAAVSSALGWQHTLAGLPPAQREGFTHAVPALLQEFMELI